MKNQYAYLEEDNDCDIFIKAKNELLKAGEKLKFNSKFSARANIRNYEYFDPSKAMDNLKARQIVLLRKKFFARVNDLSNKLAYQYNVGNNTKNFDPVKLSRLLHQHTRIENIYLNNKWG